MPNWCGESPGTCSGILLHGGRQGGGRRSAGAVRCVGEWGSGVGRLWGQGEMGCTWRVGMREWHGYGIAFCSK